MNMLNAATIPFSPWMSFLHLSDDISIRALTWGGFASIPL